jgi:hypothetical protein
MAKATKDMLGAASLTVVADAGYSSGTVAAACEATPAQSPCAFKSLASLSRRFISVLKLRRRHLSGSNEYFDRG